MEYVDACELSAVAPGTARAVRIGGRDIALFNVDGCIHAIEDSCLHGGASLAAGKFCGRHVTCRAHGWRFDVTTGALAAAPTLAVPSFPVKVADGRILVAAAS